MTVVEFQAWASKKSESNLQISESYMFILRIYDLIEWSRSKPLQNWVLNFLIGIKLHIRHLALIYAG